MELNHLRTISIYGKWPKHIFWNIKFNYASFSFQWSYNCLQERHIPIHKIEGCFRYRGYSSLLIFLSLWLWVFGFHFPSPVKLIEWMKEFCCLEAWWCDIVGVTSQELLLLEEDVKALEEMYPQGEKVMNYIDKLASSILMTFLWLVLFQTNIRQRQHGL